MQPLQATGQDDMASGPRCGVRRHRGARRAALMVRQAMAATQEHRPRETLSVVRCGMGGVFPNLCGPMSGRRG